MYAKETKNNFKIKGDIEMGIKQQTFEEKEREKFHKVLKMALNEEKLPKFRYENGVFIIKKLKKKEWAVYKKKWKSEFKHKLEELILKDFETVEPSDSYLHVEIAYDTPHYQIGYYFYENYIDLLGFDPMQYKYE